MSNVKVALASCAGPAEITPVTSASVAAIAINEKINIQPSIRKSLPRNHVLVDTLRTSVRRRRYVHLRGKLDANVRSCRMNSGR